ncbi:MAG TPA: hypothetical protein VFL61_01030 [Gaiellaceae bacterium]|nr:hypothetical protein [Gaiellaceae bacterium]
MRRLLVVLAAASLIGASLLAPSAASAQKPHVFAPSAHPFGASHGEWQARWFKWFMEIPAPINPLFDETGALCATNQSGPVWFTAPVAHPGTTTRACTIPAGKAIFVLGIGNECSNIEPPPFFGATEAELRACAAAGFEEFFGDASISITVDGIEVPELDRYRTQTPLFSYTLPEDNLFGLPAGTTATMAISDGNAVIIKPLPPGSHQIVTHIEAPILGGTIDVIYNLTIVAGAPGD